MHDLRARRGSSQAGIEYGMDLIDFESEWLESDGRGGFASGTAGGIRTSPLSRPAADGDHSAHRTDRARQRFRGLDRRSGGQLPHQQSAIHPERDISGRIEPHCPLHGHALAILDVPRPIRNRDHAGDPCPSRNLRDRVALALRIRRRIHSACALVAFRPRLSRAAPGEPRVRHASDCS